MLNFFFFFLDWVGGIMCTVLVWVPEKSPRHNVVLFYFSALCPFQRQISQRDLRVDLCTIAVCRMLNTSRADEQS